MIEEQFVSFDTAKMLKETGFDVPCRGGYHVNRFRYEAPTQALAARWLREVHHIDVVVDVVNEKEYCCDIYQNKQRESIAESINPSFEEAIEAGLKHSLELIKK